MGNDFILQEQENFCYLTIPKFEDTGLVRHGFSTRLGGVSQTPFQSLNLGFHVGDSARLVQQNRQILCQALKIPYDDLVAAEQVHGEAIHVVTVQDKGRGAASYETALKARDALITNIPQIPLSTYYADCVPIFFLDPDTPAIGLAHAGWKGTLAKIAAKTLVRMGAEFGTRPERCLVGIGPAIGPCCYEVDNTVKLLFAEQFKDERNLFKTASAGKWQLDLLEANYQALLEVGAAGENICKSSYCTQCQVDLFFSYRAEKGNTGRMAAILMLK